MNRPVVYLPLLAAAMVIAYFIYARDKLPPDPHAPSESDPMEFDQSDIPILSLDRVDWIEYQDADRRVRIDRREDDYGVYSWVSMERPDPKDPHPVVTEFKGDKDIDVVMERIRNFTAMRSLGKVGKDKLKAFKITGLSTKLMGSNEVGPMGKLTITSGTKQHVFLLGNLIRSVPAGYLMNKADGRVYAAGFPILAFRFSHQWRPDKALHKFSKNEVEQVVITSGRKTRRLLQKNRRDPAASYWVDGATSKRDDVMGKLLTKLMSGGEELAISYPQLPPDKRAAWLKPEPEGYNLVLTMDYRDEDKSIGFLRGFIRADPKPDAPDFAVMTENTRFPVILAHRPGSDLLKEIAKSTSGVAVAP